MIDLLSDGGKNLTITEKVDHPKYKKKRAYYDVAVLYIEDTLDYDENIRPICLPKAEHNYPDSHANEFTRLVGK